MKSIFLFMTALLMLVGGVACISLPDEDTNEAEEYVFQQSANHSSKKWEYTQETPEEVLSPVEDEEITDANRSVMRFDVVSPVVSYSFGEPEDKED